MKPEQALTAADVIGWVICVSAMIQLPVLMIASRAAGAGQSAGLLAASVLVVLAALFARLGLRRGRTWGYWLVYGLVVAYFLGWGGALLSILSRLYPPGPDREYYVAATNLGAAFFLMYCQYVIGRAYEAERSRVLLTGIAVSALVILSAAAHWRLNFSILKGPLPALADLPVIGPHLEGLKASGPVEILATGPRQRSLFMMAFSGVLSPTNLQAFAAANQLKELGEEKRPRMLALARQWKLDPQKFPVCKDPGDLCYSGRLPTNSHLIFQICLRTNDGRFTAQAVGVPPARHD